jgi:hypothetical protein
MTAKDKNTGPVGENAQIIQKIAIEIIEPSLQKALAEARKQGSAEEAISALANCYAGLLVDTLGRKAAAAYLQGHANHIASVEEQPLSS